MTTPTIDTINPSKSKTWVAAIGSILTVVVPLIVSVATYLPDPWPAMIGGVIGLLTVLGVYKAPYKPEGTSVVSTAKLEQIANPLPPVDHQSPTLPARAVPVGTTPAVWTPPPPVAPANELSVVDQIIAEKRR